MAQRTEDTFDHALGIRTRKCTACLQTLPLTEFAGQNPNCRHCRNCPKSSGQDTEPGSDIPFGYRECQAPHHVGPRVLPERKFWQAKSRKMMKWCGMCRFQSGVARRKQYQGKKIRSERKVDDWWATQAAEHP